jgi:hypothetical protein
VAERCARTLNFDLSARERSSATDAELFAVSTAGRSEKISACADFSAADSHPFLIFAGKVARQIKAAR